MKLYNYRTYQYVLSHSVRYVLTFKSLAYKQSHRGHMQHKCHRPKSDVASVVVSVVEPLVIAVYSEKIYANDLTFYYLMHESLK